MMLTEKLLSSSSRSLQFETAPDGSIKYGPTGAPTIREAVAEWRRQVSELFDAEVRAAAQKLIEGGGGSAYRFKGVGVTEAQFKALMKAEGFDGPILG